uniref:Uncharacterized protein n=1 Tax=Kalanchoe fedtschenkoi TaxID=63787 RepID=A0A7N0U214_KALFE
MLRRSVLEISRRRGIRGLPRQITAQTRPFLSSRNDFSTAAKVPAPTEKPSGSGSRAGKIIFGSAIIGAAGAAVYQYGYLDQFLGKSEHGSLEADDDNVPQDIREPVVLPKVEEQIASRGDAKEVVEKVDPRTVTSSSQELSEKLEKPNESPEIIPAIDLLIANVVDKTSVTLTTDKLAIESETDTKSSEDGDSLESTPLTTQQAEPDNKDDTRELPPPNIMTDYTPEVFQSKLQYFLFWN